jgi:hypothetical protein
MSPYTRMILIVLFIIVSAGGALLAAKDPGPDLGLSLAYISFMLTILVAVNLFKKP